MPIRKIVLLICAGSLFLSASAQAVPLWKIEGSANQVYLLGSIHFLRAEDYPLPKPVTDAVTRADVVVMELDLSRLDPIRMQTALVGMAIDTSGRDLAQLMGTQGYGQAQKLAARIDIDLKTMQQYEPWYAALQVTQLHLMKLGFDGSFGVETQLFLQALQQGKEFRGLETLEEQLGALDSLSLKTQRVFLIETLEDAVAGDDRLDSIVSAWKSGDADGLNEDLIDQLKDHRELYDSIVVQRNRKWTRSILEFTGDSRDYVVIVGAMHLVGSDSIIRMLQDAGIEARQVGR